MIAENDEEEEEEEDMDTGIATLSSPCVRHSRPPFRQSRSVDDATGAADSTDSGDSRSSSADRSSTSSPSHGPPSLTRRNPPVRPLKTVRSSPNMLNEICEEEGESDDDDDVLPKRLSPPRLMQRNTVASPEVLRKYEQRAHHQRKRITGTVSAHTLRQGQPSASSSDASDNEDNMMMSKDTCSASAAARRRYHRRDSSDHSSDTDAGPSGPVGGRSAMLAKNTRSATNSNGTDKQDKNQQNNRQQQQQQQQQHKNKQMQQQQHQNGGMLGKRESPNKSEPLSHKISNMSLVSSNLSLSSLGSGRSAKYRVTDNGDSIISNSSMSVCSATPRTARKQHQEDTLALEDEYRARCTSTGQVIHVRSKDFSDLMSRFTASKAQSTLSNHTNNKDYNNKAVKFRRRPKNNVTSEKNNALKVDINRNGLIHRGHQRLSEEEEEEYIPPPPPPSGIVQATNTTKCCSVV